MASDITGIRAKFCWEPATGFPDGYWTKADDTVLLSVEPCVTVNSGQVGGLEIPFIVSTQAYKLSQPMQMTLGPVSPASLEYKFVPEPSSVLTLFFGIMLLVIMKGVRMI